jgi:hypothetical protein
MSINSVRSPGRDQLPGHQARLEVKVGDLVIDRRPQRPVPDVELLIELRVGEAAAQLQQVRRGPTVVTVGLGPKP